MLQTLYIIYGFLFYFGGFKILFWFFNLIFSLCIRAQYCMQTQGNIRSSSLIPVTAACTTWNWWLLTPVTLMLILAQCVYSNLNAALICRLTFLGASGSWLSPIDSNWASDTVSWAVPAFALSLCSLPLEFLAFREIKCPESAVYHRFAVCPFSMYQERGQVVF